MVPSVIHRKEMQKHSAKSPYTADRTWTEHIVVPWLVVMVSHEQRRLIRFQQSFFPDIRIRIVDKRAVLNVSVGVDMAVAASSGNASAHRLITS